MSYNLPRAATSDAFTPARTLTCPGAKFVQVTAANAAVEIEIGFGAVGVVWQGSPSYRLPGVWTIPGPLDALRVRSATPGKPAQVSADAY